jgi:carboxylesterase
MGFTVYAPTLAGHCQDAAALESSKHWDWLDSLREPLNHLKAEVRHVYTAGICVGGALGLMLAHLERPKVEKAVIYSPTMQYNGWNQTLFARLVGPFVPQLRWIKPLHRLSFAERSPFGIKDERMRRFIIEGASMKGILHSMPALALYENACLNRALKAALPEIKVPTLLLHAKEDDVSSPRNAEKIKRLHGGECKLSYLHDSYHMIHVDRERELVAQMTGEYFGLPLSQPAVAHGRYEAA